jgi:hypothetical protein
MTPAAAKQLVVVSTGSIVVISTVSSLGAEGTLPSAKVPVGGLVAGVMLAVFAEFQPTTAAALAVTALLTSTFVYGGPAWKAIAQFLGRK